MFEIPRSGQCSFCQDLTGDRECVFVAEEEHAVAEMNLRPYERGAMLVIPRRHRESILEIRLEELEAVYGLVWRVAQASASALGATGMSIFQNNGVASGQSEPHFHVHVVPRYPSSDPTRRFHSDDYAVISIEEQEDVARLIRAKL
jgi:histidine triad (HIT) family protein